MKKNNTWTRKTAILLAAALTASGIPVSGAQVVYADDLPDHLIINQVYGGGGKEETPIAKSFIELYNPTDSDILLENYQIVLDNDKAKDATIDFEKGTKIAAKKSYLITGNAELNTESTLNYVLSAEDQSVGAVIDNKKYTISLKQGDNEVDKVVADSDSSDVNINISKQYSLRRKNYQDTNQNSDWELIYWKKGGETDKSAVIVNKDNLAQYAPKNSNEEFGQLHEAVQQPGEGTTTPSEPQKPVYTPVTAGTDKVKGFNNGNSSLDMEQIARYNSGAKNKDGGSLEIVEYNPVTGYAYAVSGLKGEIIAVKISGVTNGESIAALSGTEYDVKQLVSSKQGFTYGDITSVAISPDGTKLAAAVQHGDYATDGIVAVYDCKADGSLDNATYFEAGVQPDMVTFADNDTILTADEGEPRNGYGEGITDPEGSVSVISISAKTSDQVDFSNFKADELIAKNILIGKVNDQDLSPEQDLEPEYIAVSSNGKTAYVSLQEANAVAVLDVKQKQFTGIYSVGFEDYSKVAVDLDSGDDKYEAKTYDNLVGARMPDGIAIYENAGKTYVVTANEGDSREWGKYCNEKKDATIVASGKKVTLLDSTFSAGLPGGKTVLFGGRSFSIFEVATDGLKEVYDSGNDFESISAEKIPDYFNCSNDDNERDSRSGKKGPEPENVTVGKVNGKTYAFIAIERIGGIMVYDITDPANAKFVNYINSREFEAAIQGDVSPEGLCFVENKNGNPLLLAACEVSGTLPVYELKAQGENAGSGTGPSGNSGATTEGGSSIPGGETSGDTAKPGTGNETATDTKTETSTNAAGKEVEKTVTTTKDKDGNVTGTTEKSVIANAGKNTSVTVEAEKNAAGETVSAKAQATVTGTGSKSGVKGTISGSVISQITEAAGTQDVTISVTVATGKKGYTIQADASDLTAGTKLRVMEVNSKTGEYVMVNGKTYKVSESGSVSATLSEGKSYKLLTEKEAASVENSIVSTVKVKKPSVSLEKGKNVKIQMSSKFNPENVKSITYSSKNKSVATVGKAGKITAKKAGSAVVKVKVVLKNGSTKTLTVKVTVK